MKDSYLWNLAFDASTLLLTGPLVEFTIAAPPIARLLFELSFLNCVTLINRLKG